MIQRLEGEMGEVKGVVREGEEAVARLRSQLEEVQEREETSQVQLAHAISQGSHDIICSCSPNPIYAV